MPPPVDEAPLDEQLEEEASKEEQQAEELRRPTERLEAPLDEQLEEEAVKEAQEQEQRRPTERLEAVPAPVTPAVPVIERPRADPQLREDLTRLRNYVGSFSGARSRSDLAEQMSTRAARSPPSREPS